MAFNLPHSTLTPILGNDAPYEPKTETTPTFMNGKFSECLENDVALAQEINNMNNGDKSGSLQQQINILNGKVNVNKIYTSFTQINGSGAVTTPIATLFGWMESNSIAMLEVSAPNTNVYPAKYGICIIHKSNANRNSIEFVDAMTGNKYVGACHSNFASGFSGWKLVTSITSTLTLLNGWATSDSYDDLIVCRSGDLVNIHGVVNNNSAVVGGSVIATLPDIYIPSILRRSTGVLIDSKIPVAMDVNTSGGITWYGGALDSVNGLRIDITYAI